MKQNYFVKSIVAGFFCLLFLGNTSAQTTDTYRIWAKDANFLEDYYHWGTGIGVVANGSSNFSIPSNYLASVTDGVNNIFNNCFLKFENVDFGTLTDSIIFVRTIPRGAVVEFWIDREETTRYDDFYREGSYVDQSSPGDVIELSKGKFLGSFQHWYHYNFNMRWEKIKIAINPTGGKHTLYVLFRTGGKSGPRQYLGGLYYMDLHRTLGDEAIALTSTETTLQLAIGKHTLQYTVTPASASTEDLVWTVESGKDVVSVDNGTVIAMKPGVATVKCTSSRAVGDVSLTYNITVVGTSTVSDLRIEAENADTIYNTFRASGGQAFDKADFQSKGVGNNGNSGLVYAWNTNFAIYKDIDFGSFTDTIKFYHADIRGAAVEFWLDRKIINERQPTIRVPDASNDYNNVSGKELDGGVFLGRYDFLHDETFRGNDKWAEFKLPIVPVSGIHDLYVVFLRGGRESNTSSYTNENMIYNRAVGHWDWFELNRKIANIFSITPSKSIINMGVGDEETITLTLNPEVVYDGNVTWSITEGSDKIAIDQNGKVTAINTGTAKVKVTSDADSNIFTEITVNVIGVSTETVSTKLNLNYKNPISDTFNLHSNSIFENITITDLAGRVTYKQNDINSSEIKINSSEWNTGIYLVKIKSNDNIKILKVTKK